MGRGQRWTTAEAFALGQPSVTIRTEFYKPEKGRYLHPLQDRPITHYEAALIQGFPEDYLWHGTKIEIARQIGNAVPVGLARAVAEAIHQRLST
ncbi:MULTISPECIES: DNA cytosine methyltransferase [Streptomyces]|uniref:DNA cytosine methyltransferase n=1 Tax=Streptomyces TaxID=1883 RepID=UPI001E524E10|nr:DNA cytosine methyltransferase [Streptomyces flavotricini]